MLKDAPKGQVQLVPEAEGLPTPERLYRHRRKPEIPTQG